MSKLHTVTLNGQSFPARAGDVLLDAALMSGVDIPHDCRSGHCGTCTVEVISGRLLGGDRGEPGCVRACQARLFSDAAVAVEEVPPTRRLHATLAALRPLSSDVVELVIAADEPFPHLSGQYYRFAFRGFPPRPFSPTAAFDGFDDAATLRLHVKRVRGGRVTPEFGRAIRPGHRLTLEGPFGRAYLRPGQRNRLVLAGSGTGFAPVWAVADAALREWSGRPIVMIAGARDLRSLYMLPAFVKAAGCPHVTLRATTQEPQSLTPWVRHGSPAEHLPRLTPSDIVYAAGAPAMVEAAGVLARRAGARFYADPFTDQGNEASGWLSELLTWRPRQARSRAEAQAPRSAELSRP